MNAPTSGYVSSFLKSPPSASDEQFGIHRLDATIAICALYRRNHLTTLLL